MDNYSIRILILCCTLTVLGLTALVSSCHTKESAICAELRAIYAQTQPQLGLAERCIPGAVSQ